MPPVQFTSNFADIDKVNEKFKHETVCKSIDAAFKDIGTAIEQCNVSSKCSLMGASKYVSLNWNSVTSYSKS
eukprot:15366745-Ditylum_brightwellii.AAC.1